VQRRGWRASAWAGGREGKAREWAGFGPRPFPCAGEGREGAGLALGLGKKEKGRKDKKKCICIFHSFET
jgi:hypothetical protein